MGKKQSGSGMKIIENTILTVFLLAMLAVCWHLTFKEGGAWDYNMEQVLNEARN